MAQPSPTYAALMRSAVGSGAPSLDCILSELLDSIMDNLSGRDLFNLLQCQSRLASIAVKHLWKSLHIREQDHLILVTRLLYRHPELGSLVKSLVLIIRYTEVPRSQGHQRCHAAPAEIAHTSPTGVTDAENFKSRIETLGYHFIIDHEKWLAGFTGQRCRDAYAAVLLTLLPQLECIDITFPFEENSSLAGESDSDDDSTSLDATRSLPIETASTNVWQILAGLGTSKSSAVCTVMRNIACTSSRSTISGISAISAVSDISCNSSPAPSKRLRQSLHTLPNLRQLALRSQMSCSVDHRGGDTFYGWLSLEDSFDLVSRFPSLQHLTLCRSAAWIEPDDPSHRGLNERLTSLELICPSSYGKGSQIGGLKALERLTITFGHGHYDMSTYSHPEYLHICADMVQETLETVKKSLKYLNIGFVDCLTDQQIPKTDSLVDYTGLVELQYLSIHERFLTAPYTTSFLTNGLFDGNYRDIAATLPGGLQNIRIRGSGSNYPGLANAVNCALPKCKILRDGADEEDWQVFPVSQDLLDLQEAASDMQP
ncbi:Hypothetical protein D9617_20g027370 [Elsinoe fawcettii]|nr:Hypothetical protein D9617_20g027370 [Elsinoe fawcettii]